MRKYLDIPLTLILTVTMLWQVNQLPLGPDGSDEVVHVISFAALAFPLARTDRFGLITVFLGSSAFCGIIEVL